MHQQARSFVARCVGIIGSSYQSVLEIGGYDVNGRVRDLFADAYAYTAIDTRHGPGVDEVADGATYTPPAPVDICVCCEVLEHTTDPAAIVANMQRIVRPGGWLIITAAAPGRAPHGVNGGPVGDEPYTPIAESAMRKWLEACSYLDVATTLDGEDVQALAQMAPTKTSRRKKA